jgi:hypothetical protein
MASRLTGIRDAHGLAGIVGASLCIAACGAGAGTNTVGSRAAVRTGTTATRATATHGTTGAGRTAQTKPTVPSYPRLLSSALSSQPTAFVPVASWDGQTAAWIARSSSGVVLLSFDQRLVQLHLHSGTLDAGPTGWRFGPMVAGQELHHLVAAFNGAFKFSTGSGGYMAYGRVAVPLRAGVGSIVTYANGQTDIGSWGLEVPEHGQPIASVRQNLPLLIDHGREASTLGCLSCWGATLDGVIDPARSALGITADGRLIWVGGEHLTVGALADALLGARVVRAVQLDINPYWVAGYLYGHRGGKGPPAPVPVIPGQSGIPGQYLSPWTRDFFTVVTR